MNNVWSVCAETGLKGQTKNPTPEDPRISNLLLTKSLSGQVVRPHDRQPRLPRQVETSDDPKPWFLRGQRTLQDDSHQVTRHLKKSDLLLRFQRSGPRVVVDVGQHLLRQLLDHGQHGARRRLCKGDLWLEAGRRRLCQWKYLQVIPVHSVWTLVSQFCFRRILDYSNKNPWLYAVYVVLVGLPLVLIITFCCSGSSDKPGNLVLMDTKRQEMILVLQMASLLWTTRRRRTILKMMTRKRRKRTMVLVMRKMVGRRRRRRKAMSLNMRRRKKRTSPQPQGARPGKGGQGRIKRLWMERNWNHCCSKLDRGSGDFSDVESGLVRFDGRTGALKWGSLKGPNPSVPRPGAKPSYWSISSSH